MHSQRHGEFPPRPTITSRMLALTWISVFDAWSRYDDVATPLYLTTVERRPQVDRTLQNKEIAISYAAYRAMLHYFYSDSTLLRKRMMEFGLDPDNSSLDPTTPIGIGNLAAKTVIESKFNDGSNQKGKFKNSSEVPHRHYTVIPLQTRLTNLRMSPSGNLILFGW